MPIGTITMILATVGSQVYNSWCNSRQNAELQQKREEYERAARKHNTEQMWRLLHEGQELTMQLEAEKHKQRLDEMKGDLDNLLHKLAYETAISNWPLKILPIVMKNQAFGNLLANQEESVAMHVFFTRSNYDKFNKLVFPVVEKELEQYCNKYWSTLSDHPVLFYSGAWKTSNNPTSVQVDALRSELSSLPTLLITPFFRPNDGKLVFQVHLWGVGALSSNQFDIPEIEPQSDENHFKYTYTNQQDYEEDKVVLDSLVNDLVPYLQCLIGYMADTYFWSSAGLAPHLPLLLTNGTINANDVERYLVNDSREYYDKLLIASEVNAKENPFVHEKLLNFYEGSADLWDDEEKRSNIEDLFLLSCNNKTSLKLDNLEDALSKTSFTYSDIKLLSLLKSVSSNKSFSQLIEEKINQIKSKIHCSVVEIDDLPFEDILIWCKEKISKEPIIQFVSIEIENGWTVATLLDGEKNFIDNELSPMCCVFTYKHLVVPDFVILKNNTLLLSTSKFLSFYNQIIN